MLWEIWGEEVDDAERERQNRRKKDDEREKTEMER
jgi:hypothetical protein